MKSGVYLILQLSTGKHYVGSAVDLDRRWSRHQKDLAAGRHHNQKLQRAWDKYGPADFRFDVIERTADLIQREQHWILGTRPFFNVLRKAYSAAGYKHDDQAKAKNSEATKRYWLSLSEEQKAIRIANHAEKIKGKKHSEETKRKMSEAHKCVPKTQAQLKNLALGKTKEAREKQALTRSLTYVVTSPSGQVEIVRNLSAFCREYGLSQTHMSAVANGKRRHHKGWLCSHRDLTAEARQRGE